MYVCICNAYRSSQIIAAARSGLDDAEEIYHELGHGPICRCCLEEAQALVDAEHETEQTSG